MRGIAESREELFIHSLESYLIVGINACEREQAQLVRFDISMQRRTNGYNANTSFPFRELALTVTNVRVYPCSMACLCLHNLQAVDRTSYLTLEALVSMVADTIASSTSGLSLVTVCGGKPNALACAEAAEVKVTRQLKDIVQGVTVPTPQGLHVHNIQRPLN